MGDYYRFKRPGTITTSLDDLVEENETIPKKLKTSHRHKDDADDDDEIDPIDAYMANLDKEEKIRSKQSKQAKMASDDSDSEDDIEKTRNANESIANTSSTNKTIKRLTMLGQKDVSYQTFRKNFYVEVPELAKLTDMEVKELRMSLENITVVGKSCPKPAMCWAHCGLSRKVMDVLKKLKYLSPTPIQAQAIPAIMSGRDVIGIAKTGCGKTLSFLLPMFRHILDQPKLQKTDGPIAVIITPTRELATQICDDASKFTRALGLRAVSLYGGANISEQIALLKLGAEIVVCTPGRMIEILTANGGRVTNLNRCTFLVLDEADRLFDAGFEKQVTSIVNLIRPDRQTVLFSATFPKIMEAHARRILHKPIEIQVGGRSVVCKDVYQTVYVIEEDTKFQKLIQILMKHVDDKSSAIVFVARQEKADHLLQSLQQSYDPTCLVLHGGIDKDDRISTFASFKSGQKKVLVATSVAARGLDVKNCICVVNYDCPNHYEDYVHRCGRTGRAGNKGFAYTFITPDQPQHANSIIKALTTSENKVPDELQKLWDEYKAEQERLGNKVWTSSGFSGKGYKFDDTEAQLLNEKKRHQKKSLGLQNSDDEDNEAGAGSDGELDVVGVEAEMKKLRGRNGTAQVSSKTTENQQTKIKTTAETKAALSEKLASKLDLVKQRAASLLGQKQSLQVTDPLAAIIAPQIPADVSKLATTAQGIEATMRGKLNTVAPIVPVVAPVTSTAAASPDSDEPLEAVAIGDRFEMDLEINDCDYAIRRRLTSKDTLNKISEQHETGITVRGTYCEPGKKPTQKKLYLALEGKSKLGVERAYLELSRLIKDEEARLKSAPMLKMGKFKIL